MFRSARNTFRIPHLQRIRTSSSAAYRGARGHGLAISLASALVTGSALWYTSARVHNDALVRSANADLPKTTPIPLEKPKDPNTLSSFVWGSNANKTLSPDAVSDPIPTPTVARWLDGVALRDLQLHQRHSACVDAKGDVYQWGDGFFGDISQPIRLPKRTLRGKNIVELQLTEDKVYALSASGKVYTLASTVARQELRPGTPTPSSDGWWGTGWLWGEDETVDFTELTAYGSNLGWREYFVSIKAGRNHLLALTSKGRVFAHPVNKKGNHYGQLGFSKFSMPGPASQLDTHLHVELVPKSLADPYSTSTPSIRLKPTSYTSANLADVDDTSIRFCPHLLEIPVLRGTDVAEVAAGARTSFIRTPSGKVLAWGANEYGQLGLGSNIILDTITIPTEVILWRFTPETTDTRCLSVSAGGDLSSFIVEREANINAPTLVDVLMSGNGQFGGLGNNAYTTAQSTPSRVKGISGLVQYSDCTQRLEPIRPGSISISPTGHVLATLNSSTESGIGGRDLMVWGRNQSHELGNAKKSTIASPTGLQTPDGERFMLMRRKAKEVKDLHGNIWKKGVDVEQREVVGYENSAVYWKIV
ncbi:RCC1/BLIP-II [Gymnopilus junonius]|uniref:RCC1/BLIP-II n=1 Tax=Gymnopilus junonius TaxID=109634 RepID=A0A9P5P0I8_GYMJU|nr:RCC1/BLIP-II [Gymnopilus junonius]